MDMYVGECCCGVCTSLVVVGAVGADAVHRRVCFFGSRPSGNVRLRAARWGFLYTLMKTKQPLIS